MMKSIIKPIILLALSVIGFTACQELVLGPDEPNNPEHIFELLWNDFDAHYALFDVKGIDWEERYAEYRPKITSETSIRKNSACSAQVNRKTCMPSMNSVFS